MVNLKNLLLKKLWELPVSISMCRVLLPTAPLILIVLQPVQMLLRRELRDTVTCPSSIYALLSPSAGGCSSWVDSPSYISMKKTCAFCLWGQLWVGVNFSWQKKQRFLLLCSSSSEGVIFAWNLKLGFPNPPLIVACRSSSLILKKIPSWSKIWGVSLNPIFSTISQTKFFKFS